MRITTPALALLAVTSLGLAPALHAQTVRGQVVDSVTSAAVGTGFVVLLGPDGEEVARSLTSRDGRFSFRLTPDQAGPLSLRSERIGYHVAVSEPFDVPGEGETVDVMILVGSLPVPLTAIEVRGATECRTRPGERERTAVVWEEARKALSAASWTASAELFRMVSDTYERDWDGFRTRVLREEHELFVGYFANAFVSRDPTELAKRGYVQTGDTSITFFAPDAEVFQDEGFLETHCFRLTEEQDEGDALIGLGFEPVPSRELPDVEGVLWLDREASELRSIDYRYTNLEYNLRTEFPVGGRVEFMPLPSGAWIVHRWSITVPTALLDEREHALAEVRHMVEEWGDAGGEVLSITAEDGTRVYLAELAQIIGVVVDSTQGGQEPLAGAEVGIADSWFKGTTNPQGIFQLATSLEGEYSVTFAHPRADSLGYVPPSRKVGLARGRTDTLWLAIPPIDAVMSEVCPAFAGEADGRAVVGRVTDSATGEPARGAQVVALWPRGAPGAEFRDRRARVTTDASGRFALCGLESRRPTFVYATGDHTVSELVRVSFANDGVALDERFVATSDRIFRRDLTLQPNTPGETLVAGVVTDAATGNLIPGVPITVVNTGNTVTTDSAGTFRLTGLAPGVHRLLVDRPGYGRRVGNVEVEADRPTFVPGELVALTPVPQITGTMVDNESDSLLADAWALLVTTAGDSLAMTQSDDSGRFTLTAPAPGSYYVVARRPGYRSGSQGPFQLRLRQAVEVEFTLQPLGVALDPTIVTAEAPVPSLTAVGFYERRAEGRGVFLDRSFIEQRAGAAELGDLLRAVPGVTVDFNGLIRMRGIVGGGAGGCGAPLVYIDGLAVNRDEATGGVVDASQWQRTVTPDEIEAIEVYRSPSAVPAQYNVGGAGACGVILIWRRQGP